jgi:hypothetical protein
LARDCGGDLRYRRDGLTREAPTQKGIKVRFLLSDVFLPTVDELRALLGTEKELEGTVIEFSDSGSRRNVFAIVEVLHRETLVVPTEKLRMATSFDTTPGQDA